MSSVVNGQKDKSAVSANEKAFAKLGLHEAADFIVHLPIRYEDETRIIKIGQAKPGEYGQFEGTIQNSELVFKPSKQLKVRLVDDPGALALRWLHVYPGQKSRLSTGKQIRVVGEVRAGYHGLEIVHPKVVDAKKPLAKTLTPVYPTTQGLKQVSIHKAIKAALAEADLSETIPNELIKQYGL